MNFEFHCEQCGAYVKARRGKGQVAPRYCSTQCKVEAQRQQEPAFASEWLHEKYIVEGLGCSEIGRIVNRDAKTILYWLRKYEIPTRPRGSNYQNNFQRGQPEGWRHSPESIEKIRQASIERKQVPYLRDGRHYNKGNRGAVVHNWKGGITPERQTFYRSDEWKAAEQAVWERDKGLCRRCGLNSQIDRRKHRFHVHHIAPFECKELRAVHSNLVLLCCTCHRFVHSKRNVNREYLAQREPA